MYNSIDPYSVYILLALFYSHYLYVSVCFQWTLLGTEYAVKIFPWIRLLSNHLGSGPHIKLARVRGDQPCQKRVRQC